MTWTQLQQQRLQVERQILKKYFPSFSWINPGDSNNTRVEGNVCTNAGNVYTLRVYVPSDFPNSRPDMVVTSPYPCRGYRGKDLKEYGLSGTMHTLDPRDGYVKICHYREWLPNLTVYLVVLKGRIWLEALEGHRRTGQAIDSFLPHMQ
ncbi:hypothetical protein [Microcoleus sp. CAWBG640]|uniref:hypothetical protein n=1 Tax=Microcoleus sp. CAWBG640 TaxID=2841653 RepID=UPI00312B465F